MAGVAQKLQAERLKFPGMLPREIVVLKSWLSIHEGEYDRFDYNLRLGKGDDPGNTFPDNIRKMAVENTQKRVDAVAWKGTLPTIIEVKDRATASAIGQLVTYRALWLQTFPSGPSPKMLLVANKIAPDIVIVLQHAGIAFDIVVADFGQLRRDTAP